MICKLISNHSRQENLHLMAL